ncbi:hypothetical protein [uncultured Nostoc sp.]
MLLVIDSAADKEINRTFVLIGMSNGEAIAAPTPLAIAIPSK